MEVIIVELGFYDHISTEIQEHALLKFKFYNKATTTAQHIHTSLQIIARIEGFIVSKTKYDLKI